MLARSSRSWWDELAIEDFPSRVGIPLVSPGAADFCNKIGTFATCRMTLRMSAGRGRPEESSAGSE